MALLIVDKLHPRLLTHTFFLSRWYKVKVNKTHFLNWASWWDVTKICSGSWNVAFFLSDMKYLALSVETPPQKEDKPPHPTALANLHREPLCNSSWVLGALTL